MAKEGSTVSGLMDAFATAVSLALQHGVPLKILCEKFAHTRFEPSGWTGNPQIGLAKSLMDYIFRWLHLRFLSGEQLTLFAGLAPQAKPLPAASPSMLEEPASRAAAAATANPEFVRKTQQVARQIDQLSHPAGGGIAPPAASWQSAYVTETTVASSLADRGIYHASEAMRDMYEMGDAPSCPTCGAIMVRNGSCYRCMSCGSTSGCS